MHGRTRTVVKLEGSDSMVCAAQVQQIRCDGVLISEAIEDPQTHVIHVYVYSSAVDGGKIVPHIY